MAYPAIIFIVIFVFSVLLSLYTINRSDNIYVPKFKNSEKFLERKKSKIKDYLYKAMLKAFSFMLLLSICSILIKMYDIKLHFFFKIVIIVICAIYSLYIHEISHLIPPYFSDKKRDIIILKFFKLSIGILVTYNRKCENKEKFFTALGGPISNLFLGYIFLEFYLYDNLGIFLVISIFNFLFSYINLFPWSYRYESDGIKISKTFVAMLAEKKSR